MNSGTLTRDTAVGFLHGLVSIPSLSRDEGKAAAWLTGQMQALGYDRAYVDAAGTAVGEIGPASAARMVRGIKALSVLEGARGTPPADVAAIEDCLLRLSGLVTDFERIVELDVNPLIVAAAGGGAAVADVRIRLDGALRKA